MRGGTLWKAMGAMVRVDWERVLQNLVNKWRFKNTGCDHLLGIELAETGGDEFYSICATLQ